MKTFAVNHDTFDEEAIKETFPSCSWLVVVTSHKPISTSITFHDNADGDRFRYVFADMIDEELFIQ